MTLTVIVGGSTYAPINRTVTVLPSGSCGGGGGGSCTYAIDPTTASYAAAGGNDEAHLYGLDGAKDAFWASLEAGYSKLYDGSSFQTVARRFETVAAYGRADDDDQAFLFDSTGDDHLEADARVDPNRATLFNAAQQLEVYDFSRVKATRSAGTDTKHEVNTPPDVLDYVFQTVGDWTDV